MSGIDSPTSSGAGAVDSTPSITRKNGNTNITNPQNSQPDIANNNGLCNSFPMHIHGNTTTGAVTPSNILHSISSTTPVPSSGQLQIPPPIRRHDMNDARHHINRQQPSSQHPPSYNIPTTTSAPPHRDIASSTSLLQSARSPNIRKRAREVEPTSPTIWQQPLRISRSISLKSGSSSIVIPSHTKVIHLDREYCRWSGFDETCPYVSSNGKEVCPCADNMCNYDHKSGCIKGMSIPYLPECPTAVSYSTDEDGRPAITLFDNVLTEGAGESIWMHGGIPIREDHPNPYISDIAKQREKWIDKYNIDLPPLYLFDSTNGGSLPPYIHEEHFKMQLAMMIISIAVADVPDPLRKMYEYAESSAQTFAKNEAAAKSKGKATFSFSVLYSCQLNPAQAAVMKNLMDDCASIYDDIYRPEKYALNVKGRNWKDVNVFHPALSIDHSRPFLYEHLELDKEGIAGLGYDRFRRYQTIWTKEGNPGSPPIVRGIDFHNVSPAVQRRVVKATDHFLRKYTYGPNEVPETYGDTLIRSSKGLPSQTQDIFHFCCYSQEESPHGGGKAVHGMLSRLIMSIAESGSQVSRERRGYATNDNANAHEFAQHNIPGACVTDHFEVLKNVDDCFAKMDPRMRESWLEGICEALFVCLSWEPGRLKSCPPKFREVTNSLFAIIWPNNTIYNPFVGPPVEDPETFEDCHSKEALRSNEGARQEESVVNTIAKIDILEEIGGRPGVFESNDLGWEIRGYSLIVYMTRERAPLGDGRRWRICWEYRNITLLCIDISEVDGNIVRLAVVFRPLCNILMSKAGVKIRDKRLESGRNSAMSGHWLYVFFDKLRTPNADPITGDGFDIPVEQHILYIFYSFVYFTRFFHGNSKAGVLAANQIMAGKNFNVFHEDFTKLLKKYDYDIMGPKSRCLEYGEEAGGYAENDNSDDDDDDDDDDDEYTMSSLNAADSDSDDDDDESISGIDENDESLWVVAANNGAVLGASLAAAKKKKRKKMKINKLFITNMLIRIMSSDPDADDDEFTRNLLDALHYMEHDDFNSSRLRPQTVSARFRYFVDSGIISGETKTRFMEEYLCRRNNSGNRTAHHAPTNEEIEIANELLDIYAKTGQPFYIQAKVEEGAQQAGENFVEPPIGTVMTVIVKEKKKGQVTERTVDSFFVKGVEQTIEYGINPPAKLLPGLVYASLKERFKPDSRQHNTNATKATKYGKNYQCCVPTFKNVQNKYVNMIDPNKRNAGYKIPEHNVVLVWFEEK